MRHDQRRRWDMDTEKIQLSESQESRLCDDLEKKKIHETNFWRLRCESTPIVDHYIEVTLFCLPPAPFTIGSFLFYTVHIVRYSLPW